MRHRGWIRLAAIGIIVAVASVSAATLTVVDRRAEAAACGNPLALPRSYADFARFRLGRLTLQPGYRRPYRHGVPYKVGITRFLRGASRNVAVKVTGWRCSDHLSLRFAYINRFRIPTGWRLTFHEIRTLGTELLVLPANPPLARSDVAIYTGYMLFASPGDWKIEASFGDGRASLVIRI